MDKGCCHLIYDVMHPGRTVVMFQRILLPPSFWPIKGTSGSSDTLAHPSRLHCVKTHKTAGFTVSTLRTSNSVQVTITSKTNDYYGQWECAGYVARSV